MIGRKELERLCRATVPNARMAFLGGSQVVDGGANKVTGSDYDIVVLTTHTPYPVSYNHHAIPSTDATADLIVRDAETLAFDLADSKQRARAAVANIIACGDILFDDAKTSAAIRQQMAGFLHDGPFALDDATYAAEFQELTTQSEALYRTDKAMRRLGAFELTHRAAALHLYRQGKWHATGKLLGRFLLQDQMFKKKLETRHNHMSATGDTRRTTDVLPLPGKTGNETPQASPCLIYAPFERDEALLNEFKIHFSAETLRQYKNENASDARINDFMASKAYTLVQALNPQRIGRASNEYFYALCRVVYNLSEFAEVKNGKELDGNIVSRYGELLRECPTIGGDVDAAAAGKPERLKATVETFCASLSDEYDGAFVRRSPTTFRMRNETLSALIG